MCVNTEFDDLKMNKTVSERIVLTHILNYLETVILHIVFNVNVYAKGVPSSPMPSKVSWFIFIRIKKDEDQGKEKCHTKSMISKETNERLKETLSMCRLVVYYESIKRELKTKPIYKCLCDERPT